MNEYISRLIAQWYAGIYENLQLAGIIRDATGAGDGAISTAIGRAIDISIDKIIPAVEGIGMAIALLFFIMAMVDLASSERLTLEFFIKFFSRLAISVVLISFSASLVRGVINMGNAITTEVSAAVEASTSGSDGEDWEETFYEEIVADDTNWIAKLLSAVGNILIMSIASMIVMCVTYIVGFTRILELCVRGCMLPIALGLLADDGWRGAGGRYIRKFIAVCAQGAVLMVIAAVSQNLMLMAGITTELSTMLMTLGIAFATVSIMFKSIGIINDVFGA